MTRESIRLVAAAFVLWCLPAVACQADPSADKPDTTPVVTGKVTEVTFYRGQALVTRQVPVAGKAGAVEVVVGPLPEQIVPQSLFAEPADGVEIRAVRYRTRALGEEPREEVRKLDEQLESIVEQSQAVQRDQQVLARETAYLDQMDNFVLPTMKTDLARGFLDASALEKLTKLSFDRREALAKKTGELEKNLKELNKQLRLLQRKRAELTAGAQKASREAVLFLNKRGDANQDVRLSYLVSNCNWSPAYTIRATDGKDVALECNGVVMQMTGEDWNDVKLTLSTASPALSASGPGLAPFPISLIPAGTADNAKADATEIASKANDIRNRQVVVAQQGRNVTDLDKAIGLGWLLNRAAGDFQTLELAAGKELLASRTALADAEGPCLSYRLPHPVSLPSRRDQQMVRIMQTSIKGSFYHVATPVLSSYVYREAELRNQSSDDLLAGPITVYLDGRFVGRSEIPTVARGQTFVVGFGADPQLRARRELVERTEVVQGGNRELSFKYRLVLENFKTEPVALRLFDRVPFSDRPAEVRIRLGEFKEPLSTDALYVRTEKPKNILRWDLSVPAGATAEKARLLEYGFTIEFDRNLTVGLPTAEAVAEEAEANKGPVQPPTSPARLNSTDKAEDPFAEGRSAPSSYGGMGGMAPPSSQYAVPQSPAKSSTNASTSFKQYQEMQRSKLAR